MAGLSFFKRIVPIALACAAALVMAIPMSASAGDWNRHEQIAHQAWLARHQNWSGVGTIFMQLRQLTFPRTRHEPTDTRRRP
jgi:hypothetical protein